MQHHAGANANAITDYVSNVFVGSNIASFPAGSLSQNVVIGHNAYGGPTTYVDAGDNNVIIGYAAGSSLGPSVGGSSVRPISGNVLIGNEVGQDQAISNRLYIHNSNTTTPLIYGEFDNDLLRVNGNFQRTVYGSTETTTTGTLHIRDNTNWATQADATDNTASTGLLGVAQGAQANVGLVLFGDVDYTITGNVGIPVYLDTTAGGLTTTAPTGSGNIVRVMGYIIGTNKVFFNPSNDWLEIV